MERTSSTSSDRRTGRTHLQPNVCAAGQFLFALTVFLGAVVPATAENHPGPQPKIDFERDVQPILASKCVRCHGPQTAEAGLRLDNRKTAIGPLDSGTRAIIPGKPNESELIRRVSADPSERMPPEGDPLTKNQITTLQHWIAAGADWPDHWAYRPLKLPAPPRFDNPQLESWVRTPIDRFVLKALRDRGLQPPPPADRRALLRRVYFDLIG